MLISLMIIPQSEAIQLTGVHYSACKREVGLILNVTDQKIQMVNLEGEIVEINRFDLIYMVTYPSERLNITKIDPAKELPLMTISTLFNSQIEELVKGWMINHSEDQISFISIKGEEIVIDRSDIWDISIEYPEESIVFENLIPGNYHFAYPYPFKSCDEVLRKELADEKSRYLIFPQHLLEEPLMIKMELDRLQEGFKDLDQYTKDKVFYPIPQLFSNDTSIAIWANLGSRYGNSKFRNSSFIPGMVSELSEGPFGFQRVFITGTAPMAYGVTSEPQVQFYYGMKSNFFHFSTMYDFNSVLIGPQKYRWQKEELESQDDRWNDTFHIGGGFDWSFYAIDFTINDVQYGVRVDDNFFTNSFTLIKTGLFYKKKSFQAEFYYGAGTDKKKEIVFVFKGDSPEEEAYIDYLNEKEANKPEFFGDFQFLRINARSLSDELFQPRYSLIIKDLTFRREKDGSGEGQFFYKGFSISNTVYGILKLDYNINLQGYIGIETVQNEGGVNGLKNSQSKHYFKSGASVALVF